MDPGGAELEVLVPLVHEEDENGTEAGTPRRPSKGGSAGVRGRRRWPVVVVAVALIAISVAFPLRDRLARSELRWLERQWISALGDDSERIVVEQHLKAYSSVVDRPDVDPALAALFTEEQHRFELLQDRLQRAVVVDHGLSLLRDKMSMALDHRAILFGRVAAAITKWPPYTDPPPNADDQTAADLIAVDHALKAERTRWGEQRPPLTPSLVPYAAATTALAHLAHWLDHPTGAVLLARSAGNNLVRLDVDASKVVATEVPALQAYPVARSGYLAYSTDGRVWAVRPDGSGPPRLLANGDSLFAATDSGAVWVHDALAATVIEVNGTGRVLAGPLRPPGVARLATSVGLVVSLPGRPGFGVWDPGSGRTRCRTASAGTPNSEPLFLGARANLLVLAFGSGQLHLIDVTTCVDRTIPVAVDVTGPVYAAQAAFSPDGRTLAVASAQVSAGGADTFPLQLVDVTTGQVTYAPLNIPGIPVSAIAWTPDGSHLFWLYNGVTNTSSFVETWRVGDPNGRPLRIVNVPLNPPLYIVP